jgi:tetratricopeptide (TPR) repeat protein
MKSPTSPQAWNTTCNFSRLPAVRPFSRAVSLALPVLPIAIAILQGCASAPPVPQKQVEKPTETAVKPAAVIPPQIQAEFDSAMALVKSEQYEKAVESFNKLTVALPDNPIPLINIALIYKKTGKLDLAESQLKQALVVEPDNPVASNELALLYRKTGRFSNAKSVYESVLVKYPNFNIAHKNLGVLCDLYLKNYECAITHYKIYSLGVPDDKNVHIWIADLQKRTGK